MYKLTKIDENHWKYLTKDRSYHISIQLSKDGFFYCRSGVDTQKCDTVVQVMAFFHRIRINIQYSKDFIKIAEEKMKNRINDIVIFEKNLIHEKNKFYKDGIFSIKNGKHSFDLFINSSNKDAMPRYTLDTRIDSPYGTTVSFKSMNAVLDNILGYFKEVVITEEISQYIEDDKTSKYGKDDIFDRPIQVSGKIYSKKAA